MQNVFLTEMILVGEAAVDHDALGSAITLGGGVSPLDALGIFRAVLAVAESGALRLRPLHEVLSTPRQRQGAQED